VTSPKHTAALAYAALGWPVLPFHAARLADHCSCTNGTNCERPGKHPRVRGGAQTATRERHKIDEWWRQWPDANIAGATGLLSGFVVLDIDPRNGGYESLRALEAKYEPLPATRAHATGGGGEHRVFRWAADVPQNRVLAPGLDFLSSGKLAILPGSDHSSGRAYTIKSHAPAAQVPGWLREVHQEAHSIGRCQQASNVAAVGQISAKVGRGDRNRYLTSEAGLLRYGGLSVAGILTRLIELNGQTCSPPLPDTEVQKIARSVGRYPIGPGFGAELVSDPRWPGVAGATDAAVLGAHFRLARGRINTPYPGSIRILAEDAGVHRDTVVASHRRLAKAQLIIRHKPPAERGHAHTFSLTPSAVASFGHSEPRGVVPPVVGAKDRTAPGASFHSGHDAFRWPQGGPRRGGKRPRGVGKNTLRVLRILLQAGPRLAVTLAHECGINRSTAGRILRDCESFGLVTRDRRMQWHLRDCGALALRRVAYRRGVAGVGRAQRATHRRQRHDYLAACKPPLVPVEGPGDR
jgi:DNA-binding MarR family transcriptional regulator